MNLNREISTFYALALEKNPDAIASVLGNDVYNALFRADLSTDVHARKTLAASGDIPRKLISGMRDYENRLLDKDISQAVSTLVTSTSEQLPHQHADSDKVTEAKQTLRRIINHYSGDKSYANQNDGLYPDDTRILRTLLHNTTASDRQIILDPGYEAKVQKCFSNLRHLHDALHSWGMTAAIDKITSASSKRRL